MSRFELKASMTLRCSIGSSNALGEWMNPLLPPRTPHALSQIEKQPWSHKLGLEARRRSLRVEFHVPVPVRFIKKKKGVGR